MKGRELRDFAKKIYRDQGDALQAEQVIAQARFIGKKLILPGSSAHRIQQIPLRGNVLCVIDKSFRITERGMHLK